MRSPDRLTRPGRGPGRWTAGAAGAALLAGFWLIHDGMSVSAPPRPPAAASDGVAADPPTPVGPSASIPAPGPKPLPASQPTRIRIPSLRVDAPLTGVGLDGKDHLVPPPMANRNLVGWYREGVSPGMVGAALAVGHVDNRTGPAVFYRLGLVRRGDPIEVLRADHRTAVFTVDAVRIVRKDAFPDAEVYGNTTRPELRLITCGGHFDHRTGYDSNVVVFSHLTAVR